MKLVSLLLALVIVVGLLPVRGEALAMSNDHCMAASTTHHAGDDASCQAPAGNQQGHCLVSSGACYAVPLPMAAAVAISPPSVVMAWGLQIESALTGRLHRPATPPPRI